MFGVLNWPPLPSVIVLPTLKLFVSVVFAASLPALSVPSTITLPSKVSTTKELKSEVPTEDEEVVPLPVYTLVPALLALLSVTVILSFGLIVLSEAFAITAAAAACAAAVVMLAWANSEAFVADIWLVVDSSKVNTLPPLTPAIPPAPANTFVRVSSFVAIVDPEALSIIGTFIEPVKVVVPDISAEFEAIVITPLEFALAVTFVTPSVPYLKLFAS